MSAETTWQLNQEALTPTATPTRRPTAYPTRRCMAQFVKKTKANGDISMLEIEYGIVNVFIQYDVFF